jgi:hypothetical protein
MMRKVLLIAGVFTLAANPAFAQKESSDDKPALQYSSGPVAKPKAKAKAVKPAEGEIKFAAPRAGEVVISDREFNRFVFNTPITQLVFAAGAPLLGNPIYLAGNTQVLVQVQRGADKPISTVVELEGGQVHTLNLMPRPISGVTHRVDGAREARSGAAASVLASKAAGDTAPRGEDIELLKRVVQNDVPSGFESIALPLPTRFDKFTVVPLAGWSDSASRRVLVFSLVAVPGQTAVVAPPQFYRPGISAVLVDGDVVDANNSPTLYVVEETQDE